MKILEKFKKISGVKLNEIKSTLNATGKAINELDPKTEYYLKNAIIGFLGFFAAGYTLFPVDNINAVIDALHTGQNISKEQMEVAIKGITGELGAFSLLMKTAVIGVPVHMFISNLRKLWEIGKEYRLKTDNEYKIKYLNKLEEEIRKDYPELYDFLRKQNFYKEIKNDEAKLLKIEELVKNIKKLNNNKPLEPSFIKRNINKLQKMGIIDMLEYIRKEVQKESTTKDIEEGALKYVRTRYGIK